MLRRYIKTVPLESRQRFNKSVFTFGIAGIILASLLMNPYGLPLPECLFKNVTGYPCPTCGLTRSFHDTAHLDMHRAFDFHFLGPVLFAGLLLLFLKYLHEILLNREIRIRLPMNKNRLPVLLFIAIWMGYWLGRII